MKEEPRPKWREGSEATHKAEMVRRTGERGGEG